MPAAGSDNWNPDSSTSEHTVTKYDKVDRTWSHWPYVSFFGAMGRIRAPGEFS